MKDQIGLLYLGKDSSEFYLRKLVKLGFHDVKVIATDFSAINTQLPKNFALLKDLVTPYLRQAEQKKITSLIVPNITLHETIDQLDGPFKFNFMHPVLKGAKALQKKAVAEVILFGSLHTMKGNYVKDHFKASDINTSIPLAQDMIYIDKIRRKVFDGSIQYTEIEKYVELINTYCQKSPVVLACTELSILHHSIKSSDVFDLATIQMRPDS
ncbi:MAG: aspartate racemase [Saprospiraceae bacterium]|jgi:aspartate racemase